MQRTLSFSFAQYLQANKKTQKDLLLTKFPRLPAAHAPRIYIYVRNDLRCTDACAHSYRTLSMSVVVKPTNIANNTPTPTTTKSLRRILHAY